jgi:hypothetical protein
MHLSPLSSGDKTSSDAPEKQKVLDGHGEDRRESEGSGTKGTEQGYTRGMEGE